MTVREFARFGGELVSQRINPALALNHLDNHARGAPGKGRLQRGDIVGRNEPRARHERLEIPPVLSLAGNRKRPQRTPVKRVIERNDFVLIGVDGAAVGLGHFERAFHRFGARIAEKHPRKPAPLRQFFRQRPLVRVVIQVGRVDHLGRLFAQHLQDPRVRMPQGIHANTGDRIEIAAPFRVVDVAALSAGQNQRITGIILQ